MAHFGVLSFKGRGHLNPLLALSKELTRRGHRVTFFLDAGLERVIPRDGIEFYPIHVAAGVRKKPKTRIGNVWSSLKRIGQDMDAFLREYPIAIQAAGVDTLLMGEISLAGPTVAELLGLPYFVVSTSIPHNFGWDAAREIQGPGSWFDRLQRYMLEVSIFRMRGPVRLRLDFRRRVLGLKSIRHIGRTHPALAHITQWPLCLEETRYAIPKNLFHTAAFVDETAREAIPFPWARIDGRFLVYASLGTTRRANPELFRCIAQACCDADMQLVISLGGRRDVAMFPGMPGEPVVVGNAPQLEILRRADVVIMHAGPNTVLETLMEGKPMLALPMTLDQPAVATRLWRLGVAEVLRLENRSAESIRSALQKLRDDGRYRKAALGLQAQMRPLRGPVHAADIIEERLPTKHLIDIGD